MQENVWRVIGGEGRSALGRWCQTSGEAQAWAHQLIEAGISPVKVNGALFQPEIADEGES